MKIVHSNCIRCIGTVYELNITVDSIHNIPYLKGSIVIKSNDDYIRFYINTSKANSIEYYRILETFGIQYEMIRKYDKNEYTLYEEPIQCILHGKIADKFDLRTANPTKVFLTASLTEYGYKMHYVTRTKDEDLLIFDINGSPYINNKFIIPSGENIIEMDCDTDYQEDRYRCYKLSVEQNGGYDRVQENIIDNIQKPKIKLNSIEKIGEFDKKMIDDIIILKG